MSRNIRFIPFTVLTLWLALFPAATGTAQPARRIGDINAGPFSSYPFGFQELSGNAFFLASGSIGASASFDLWRTDGTNAGTVRVVQTGVGTFSGLAATSRTLFWLEGTCGGPQGACSLPSLVMSNGTQAGTATVPSPSDLIPDSSVPPVIVGEAVLFFGSQAGGVPSLWRADGSVGGTRQLMQLPNGTAAYGPFCALHGGVAFLVRSLAGVTELWRSDGTAPGTASVKTLSSRGSPSCWEPPRRLGRSLMFLADDGSTGCNVWRSDGTAAGTVPLGVVGAGASAQMSPLGTAHGVLAFTNVADLWRTDGSAAGTFLLKSFTAAALATPPGAGTHEGVYFAVQTNGSPDTTQQLWISDGSVTGTILLHDFKAGGADARIVSLTTANGRLLATIREAVSPFPMSLWTSDGTPAGTVKVQDNAGAGYEALPYRGVTLFAGTDPWAGTELWAMDGVGFTAPVRPTTLSVLTPCRVLDTRLADDFLGGPALSAGAPRVFPVGGACDIPGTARSIAANVTVTGATADGVLRIHASDIGAPDAAVISFRAGQTRANNATISLGPDAEFTVRFEAPTGQVHMIVDVVGFFE